VVAGVEGSVGHRHLHAHRLLVGQVVHHRGRHAAHDRPRRPTGQPQQIGMRRQRRVGAAKHPTRQLDDLACVTPRVQIPRSAHPARTPSPT
jgi:hypothetical protein